MTLIAKPIKHAKKSLRIAFCFFLLILLFSSCQSKPKPTSTRFLKINLPDEPSTFDPRKGADISTCSVHWLLFEGLTRITETTSHEYGLAKAVEISKDKKTYTFTLRDSKWSNGKPLTAYDYEYSFKSMLDPSFPCANAHMLYPIKNAKHAKRGQLPLSNVGITALNSQKLQIQLEHPLPYFLNLLSFCVLSPINPEMEKSFNSNESLTNEYISNGPFRIVKYKANNEIILEKNPYYWDAKNVKLAGIHIHIIPDENTALEMFYNKELDLLGSPYTNVPTEATNKLKDLDLLKTIPLGKTLVCFFNMVNKPFNNQWIRKALSLSIDKNNIVENISNFDEEVANSFIPPILKNGVNKKFFRPFDLVLANIYLEKGLEELQMTKEDFSKYTLIYINTADQSKLAQELQASWKRNLKINIPILAQNHKVLMTRAKNRDFDLCLYYWITQYDDPMAILDRFKYLMNKQNYSSYENAQYTRLLEQSFLEEKNQRNATLELAENLLAKDHPFIPVYHSKAIAAIHPYIKGIKICRLGSIDFKSIIFDLK